MIILNSAVESNSNLHHIRAACDDSSVEFTMMTQRTSGFILMITLLLVAVFSMFILISLQRLVYTLRLNDQVSAQHQAFYALEAAAQNLQTTMRINTLDCRVNGQDISSIVPEDLFRYGCTAVLDSVTYRYLVADLGIFPCLMISTQHGNRSSHHWWLLISSERLSSIVLWLRIAVPEMSSVCAIKSAQTLVNNPLSWHLQHAQP